VPLALAWWCRARVASWGRAGGRAGDGGALAGARVMCSGVWLHAAPGGLKPAGARCAGSSPTGA